MPPKLPPAGERLRLILKGAGLDAAEAAKIAGYPFRSGLQHQLDSRQPYFHPKVIERLAKLVGHGSPAIKESQIQALAILGGIREGGGYPHPAVTDKSQPATLQFSAHGQVVPGNEGGKAVEADLLRGLIEDVGFLKKRVSDLETEVEELRRPTAARRRRT